MRTNIEGVRAGKKGQKRLRGRRVERKGRDGNEVKGRSDGDESGEEGN